MVSLIISILTKNITTFSYSFMFKSKHVFLIFVFNIIVVILDIIFMIKIKAKKPQLFNKNTLTYKRYFYMDQECNLFFILYSTNESFIKSVEVIKDLILLSNLDP
jgi:hypothetical protein